jgi:hypothetical protein
MRFGMPLPDRIQNAPELNLGSELFYTGILELTSCRQMGMGIGPIPLLAILEYCLINGIDGEQREDFIWFIQRLDSKYIEWSKSRAESK